MESLYVRNRAQALSLDAIRRYRQTGVLVVRDYFQRSELQDLAAACTTAVRARGANAFPALDPEHTNKLQFDTQMRPVATQTFDERSLPAEMKRQAEKRDRDREIEVRVANTKLVVRNAKQTDILFRKLMRLRNRHLGMYNMRDIVSREVDIDKDVTADKLKKIKSNISFEDGQRAYDMYRKSGNMELDIRRRIHYNEMMEFIHNMSKNWISLWPNCKSLKQQLLAKSGVGERLGETAAALSGEVVVRLFSDSAQELLPLNNGTPFYVAATGTGFQHPSALTAIIGLPQDESAASTKYSHLPMERKIVVLPGSHHVMQQLTKDGKNMDRLQTSSMFDVGGNMRVIPQLSHLPLVELTIEPSSVAFVNLFTFVAMPPTMTGPMSSPYVQPMSREMNALSYYSLTLMPDRCVFDGRRESWFSCDSHGPLFGCKRGDQLTDNTNFPVLHRALDIE